MLSDSDTVNLSNMDVIDECILGDFTLTDFERDATRAIDIESSSSGATLKRTKFRKTPLVCVHYHTIQRPF